MAIPIFKLHGFGGNYISMDGVDGHAQIARREIARVLYEKIEEARWDKDEAVQIGTALLRDSALANFDLVRRRAAFQALASKTIQPSDTRN